MTQLELEVIARRGGEGSAAARRVLRERALVECLEAARRACADFRAESSSPWVCAGQVAVRAGISLQQASGRLRVLAARGGVTRVDFGPNERGAPVSMYLARRP